jgi:hypothetical protein
VGRWLITDGNTTTELPAQLEPVEDAYLPPPDLQAFRPPGGTAVFYEGDTTPAPAWLDLAGGLLQAGGGRALYASVTSINTALAAATTLTREESDGSLVWPLRVGASHVIDASPVEKRSDVFTLGVRFGISGSADSGPTVLNVLITEDGDPIITEGGDTLLAA